MVSKSWIADRREWHLKWKSGGQCHLRVRVADLGGGKRAEEAAAAIAEFMKDRIERARDKGNVVRFHEVLRQKIAEKTAGSAEVEGRSSSDHLPHVESNAGPGPATSSLQASPVTARLENRNGLGTAARLAFL